MALLLKKGYDAGVQIADDPLIWVVDDFVSLDECLHVLELAEDRMNDALVSRLGHNTSSDKRTGRVAWVPHNETPMVRGLIKRVGEFVGVPALHAENLQVIHYAETQEYKAHYDAWDINTSKGAEKTARGGNRALTALIYLNEVDAGGSTGFPELEVEVEARPGRMVIFHNLYEGESVRHRNSLHGGLPVVAGEKWACNLWFRERRYQTGAPGSTPADRPQNRAARRKAQRKSRQRNR